MKLQVLSVFLLIALATHHTQGQSIMCYECDGDNCNKTDTMKKVYCGPPKPTEATTKAPTETPTEAPTVAPTAAGTEAPTAAPTEAATTKGSKSLSLRSLTPSASATLINNYRGLSRNRRNTGDISYNCYTVQYKGGDVTKTKKGCVSIPTDKKACDVVAANVAHSDEKSCEFCKSNLCNSSSMVNFSVLTMFIVVFVKFLM